MTDARAPQMITEQALLAEVTTTPPPYQRILLFAPHPDDEVFGAGGTLEHYASIGCAIQQIVITSGDRQSDSATADLRRTESANAAEILKLPEPIFWDFPDRQLAVSQALSANITEVLAEQTPDAIFVPGLDEVHPDHRATTHAVIAAIQALELSLDIIFYEISRPIAHPNWFVDITTSHKTDAMHCFESQLALEPYAERIAGLNRYRSYHMGASVSTAEAFLKVASPTVAHVGSLFESTDWDARLLRLETQLRVGELETELGELNHTHESACYEIRRLTAALNEVHTSTSWRITRPLRALKSQMTRIHGVFQRFRAAYYGAGGLFRICPLVIRIIRTEGFRILWWRVKNKLKIEPFGLRPSQHHEALYRPVATPVYLDPNMPPRTRLSSARSPKLAVHLHLYHFNQQQMWATRLNSITLPFDLFVSIPEDRSSASSELEALFRASLANLGQLQIQTVPNRGRDLAPLIITFGQQLRDYEIVGHFHSKESPHNRALTHWLDHILDRLLGSTKDDDMTVESIIEMISTRAKLVYPEAPTAILEDRTGWGLNWELASELSERYALGNLNAYQRVEFPRGSMFWARTEAIDTFLNLPLRFDDFPIEPIPADGTLAHALERLILVCADQTDGELIRLHRGDTLLDKIHYESALDFSNSAPSDVRALAFYLPQFHPIPENDRWHGKGFTEWTKVRASSPLFVGHYQQHRPHPDIGYYLLDSPEPLKKQAELLRRAGLAGMVFYHYWFSGHLILEQPAQTLLANSDIDMPFAMCWANENWTRRWDGNNEDVLLEQIYSADDARAFIRYLLPFLRDPRYLCVDGRPILLIYRPADLPDTVDYLAIWNSCCEDAGIEAPYYIGILTRGAHDPVALGMDAGLERVLHDWGGGHIPETMHQLDSYQPLHGSVLQYEDVADYYEANRPVRDGPVFRSIIPQWDNTPRYGTRANVVHQSTPERYEQWLVHLVAETREHMTGDERLIFINAWNEWAEGAHLEPDTHHGYAYLNATGRALHGADAGQFPVRKTPQHAVIQASKEVIETLGDQWPAITEVLRSLEDEGWMFYGDSADECVRPLEDAPESAWCLQFRTACVLTPHALRQLFIDARQRPDTTEAIRCLDSSDLPKLGSDGQLSRSDAFDAAIVLYPPTYWTMGVGAIRAIEGVPAFRLSHLRRHDEVTLIIRFHNAGSLDLLTEALTSVAAQAGTYAIPLIALQRPTAAIHQAVQALVSNILWAEGVEPSICTFDGADDDLRAVMLNEALKRVNTQYVGFLDYDDLLLPHACRWRIDRLKQTGKTVTFGRIFNTRSDLASRRVLERGRLYEYNETYADFLTVNHCPLHGALFDRSKLQGRAIWYRPSQKYLEDYALLLQLVTAENTDWESLTLNEYIGDYRHFDDGDHTLAITDPDARDRVLQSKEYKDATAWVQHIQKTLRNHGNTDALEPPQDGQQIVL